VGGGFGFDRRFGVSLRLGEDVGWFILVASSGWFAGLEHGGGQMLGLNGRGRFSREKEGVERRREGTRRTREQ
jgi:hypothetical protein